MAPTRSEEVLAGTSPAAERLRDQIERVARTPLTTVLVAAERGSRPDLIARTIHSFSSVAAGPFHAARCETFAAGGPGSPSFDDACPLLAAARAGTLFLEEVSALGPEAQGRLHDFLEERAGGGVGNDLRIIASASSNLEELAEAGRFREDLLYRLNVLQVRVPPLRERREDLVELGGRILRSTGGALGRNPDLSAPAAAALADHDWPGNLVELEAVLLLALLRSGQGPVETEHLSLGPQEPRGEREELIPLPPGKRSLRAVEEAMIRRVLVEEGGNRSQTARVLGINRTTLYNKLRLYGIR